MVVYLSSNWVIPNSFSSMVGINKRDTRSDFGPRWDRLFNVMCDVGTEKSTGRFQFTLNAVHSAAVTKEQFWLRSWGES